MAIPSLFGRHFRVSAMAFIATLICHIAAGAAERDPRDSAAPDKVPEPMRNIIAFEKAGTMPSKHYKIAYAAMRDQRLLRGPYERPRGGRQEIRFRIQNV